MQETSVNTSNLLVLNEEQELLQSAARDFFKEKSPVSALRKLRDTHDSQGFDTHLWQEMAEMGWAGMIIPEAYGGLDFGYLGMGIVLEESARTLAASPFFSTALISASALKLGGNKTQKEQHLPDIAQGKTIMTLALEENRHHNPLAIKTTAKKEGDYFVLNGYKSFVIDGYAANYVIVAARTSGQPGDSSGISLFIVDTKTAGVHLERIIALDSRNYAHIHLKDVKVSKDALLGDLDEAYPLLQQVLDIANICLAAELSGIMQEAFERTIAYLKERKQFGVPIGSFQGLQHRAADLYCHMEMCQSVVRKALMAIDRQADKLALMASFAKAKTCETSSRVTNEAVQMFGGIGVTDDEEIGFFLKRSRAAQMTFGDYAYHLDRFASLQGY